MKRLILLMILCSLFVMPVTAQEDENRYFTLRLIEHQIKTTNDLNGDEIFIVGTVAYQDHAGEAMTCTFSTGDLSSNARNTTLHIDEHEAVVCEHLPVRGDVAVYLEVKENDSGLETTRRVVVDVAPTIAGIVFGAYYGVETAVLSQLGRVVLEGIFQWAMASDRIHEATLVVIDDARLTFGCHAISGWPPWDRDPALTREVGVAPLSAEVTCPTLGWKQQFTTIEVSFDDA